MPEQQRQVEIEARLIYTEMRALEVRHANLRSEFLSCTRSMKRPHAFMAKLHADLFYGNPLVEGEQQ